MKAATLPLLSLLSLLPLISGHAIFQRVSVDGVDQGLLGGVRSPSSNNPVQDVSSSAITCNTGLQSPVSTKVITIPVGARVGALYQHIIGGAQGSNDPDNPIASSHKGPIIVYLAKVSDAATSGTTGLSWFKVAQEGLNGGKWGVDTLLANSGWWYFTMPSCIAPGQYLMRVELIALHSAYSTGQAQFYMACANIQITGSGSYTPSSTVSFPGAYTASDPGILINIYGTGGLPDNGGKAYSIPGPAVITCPTGQQTTTTAAQTTTTLVTTTRQVTTTTTTAVRTTTTTSAARTTTTTSASGGGTGSPLYGQCGGNGWTGPTTCAQGTCKVTNEWYSQCVP